MYVSVCDVLSFTGTSLEVLSLILEEVLCFDAFPEFPLALQTVPHEKQPSWKSVSTEQNQAMHESCIVSVLHSRTTVIPLIPVPECAVFVQNTSLWKLLK